MGVYRVYSGYYGKIKCLFGVRRKKTARGGPEKCWFKQHERFNAQTLEGLEEKEQMICEFCGYHVEKKYINGQITVDCPQCNKYVLKK